MITALRKRLTSRLPEERDKGAVTLMTVILAPILIFFVWGLIVDGGGMHTAAQRADNVAEDAARASGQQIVGSLSARGIDTVVDPVRAVAAAKRYLSDAGVEGEVIPTGPRTLLITTRIVYDNKLLPLGSKVITGSATVNLNRTNAGEVYRP
ncbi:pilus assembly protein TadG-related protein [Rhodococcus sp. 3-2]|uniref:pilus assembly protein TadG-related protein n=1 Tax=Rhodococcus sp. 3-2 TaxID=2890836 RepID=UPI001D18EE7F|nr:pilus assembly protein TadG-related protein [Rhodococcus sp. 3-2]MCC4306641.1 pilus assembly protein [Rhodococcus sp. 3-2]